MRSNIASTCGSARRPAELIALKLLQAREEVDELVELLGVPLLQRGERRHRRSRVHERPRDGLATETRADLRERGAGSRVAVLADLVAAETARRGSDLFALLVLGRPLHVDLGRRAGDRTEDRQ